MNRLILVRHGETAWNAAKRLQGQADIELSEHGRQQARALRSVVAAWAPDSVVCSDLARARETASCLGYTDPELDGRWREADLGLWTGVPTSELLQSAPERYRRWRDGQATPPQGESFPALCERVLGAVRALHERHGTVLVVTHGGAIRAALSRLIGLHPDHLVPVDPGSATLLHMLPTPRLAAFNVHRHEPVTDPTD